MAITEVTPTSEKPKHHITLYDGTTTVGLIAVKRWENKDGEIVTTQDENAIDVNPSQPLAIQTSQGDSAYSDREWPYMTLVQDDWSGGRGSETFEDDRTRYFDSNRVDTWNEGALLLGPLETYVNLGNVEQSMPGETASSGVTWGDLVNTSAEGDQRAWSTSWVQDGTWTAGGELELLMRKIGSPTTGFAYSIISDNAGAPTGALRLSGDAYGTVADFESNVSYTVRVNMTPTYALQNGQTYHLVVYWWVGSSPTDYWQVGTATGTAGGQTRDGDAVWTGGKRSLYYRILENYTVATKQQTGIVPFEYKGLLYSYTQPPTGNSFLWINGDRGVADDNTGQLGVLVDAAKTWTVNQWVGCVVKIIAGPGSEEAQPWREITSNTATGLHVSPSWNIIHTTGTEYIIIGSNTWRSSVDLGGYVTDHAVTDDYIYFARGETTALTLYRYEWYNNAGAEAAATDSAENATGKYLVAIHHPEDEHDTLYIGRNAHPQYGVAVGKMKVPGTFNDLVYPLGQLMATDTPWDDRSISNVTQTTIDQATKITPNATFTTGLVAAKNLSAPVDITQANRLGFWIKSSKAFANTGELYFVYDDYVDTDGSATLTRATPANVLIKQTAPGAVFLYSPATPAYKNLIKLVDGTALSSHIFTGVGTRLSDTVNLLVMADYKFNDIYIACGTHDATAETISALYWNGSTWGALSITDNTACLASDDSITLSVPEDWEQITITSGTAEADTTYTTYTGYAVWIDFSGELTDNINIQYMIVSRYNQIKYDLGVLLANKWYYKIISIVPERYPYPDDTQVQSVGLFIEDDQNADFNIMLKGGIDLLYNEPDWKPLPSNDKITNMIAHSGNVNEPRTNPWIFTEGAHLYELQSQNDGQFVPVTIGEMEVFKSENTGAAACVNDVYLYFSLGEEKIERWFNNSLEDVGPDGGYYYG